MEGRNPEACEACRHRKRKCYEEYQNETMITICQRSFISSVCFEADMTIFEIIRSTFTDASNCVTEISLYVLRNNLHSGNIGSSSSSATQSTSYTNLLEGHQSLNNIPQLNCSDGEILRGEKQNPYPI
ncbi:1440_t:CDS:2 [Dentiscutata heterogama]|uniref:1440_t:CDS:1 n=1 Tax=Dentiscutata heterogama TaxID=1316150 RepID=A0ACA9KVE7_9GLOM|nr:1440_t:CDS:2 [Dentiscutata heterogama]